MSKGTTFTLEDDACAIIIKKDMSTEMMLPNMKDDETIEFEDHVNIYVTMAITTGLNDGRLRDPITAIMDEMFKKMDDIAEEDNVPTCACGPESTCDHC